MEKVQVFNLDSSSKCSINCITHGANIEGPALVIVVKKETTESTADIKDAIEKGKITLNQARSKFGLNPLNEPTANELLKKV